jgi:hypothetical protein
VEEFSECSFCGPRNPKFAGLAAGRQIRPSPLATVEFGECSRYIIKNKYYRISAMKKIILGLERFVTGF